MLAEVDRVTSTVRDIALAVAEEADIATLARPAVRRTAAALSR